MSSSNHLRGALFVLALLAGCGGGQQREAVETPADTAAMAPAMPTSETGVPNWMAELRQGEAALAQSVEQGRLGEVHDQAMNIQSRLKQVADQASPDQRQQLTEHVAAADRLAGELHDAADAGDLTMAKAKLQEFKTHLRAIEGVFGVAAP